jgi:hypothetical protein
MGIGRVFASQIAVRPEPQSAEDSADVVLRVLFAWRSERLQAFV